MLTCAGRVHIKTDDDKFIGAHAGENRVRPGHRVPQRIGDLPQHRIGARLADQLVDVAEVINIQMKHEPRGVVCGHALFEHAFQTTAIEQVSEHIVIKLVGDLGLKPVVFGDIF